MVRIPQHGPLPEALREWCKWIHLHADLAQNATQGTLPMNRLLLTCLIFAACMPALAQQPTQPPEGSAACGNRADLVTNIRGNLSEGGYAETQRSLALDRFGNMVEVYGNSETGTWTELTTRPDGMTCATDFGEGFQQFSDRPDGKPA